MHDPHKKRDTKFQAKATNLLQRKNDQTNLLIEHCNLKAKRDKILE